MKSTVFDVGGLASRYHDYRTLLRFLIVAFVIGLLSLTFQAVAYAANFFAPTTGPDYFGSPRVPLADFVIGLVITLIYNHWLSQFLARLSQLERRGVGPSQMFVFIGFVANILLGSILLWRLATELIFLSPEQLLTAWGYTATAAFVWVFFACAVIVITQALITNLSLPELTDAERAIIAENAWGDTTRVSVARVTGLPAQVSSRLTGFEAPGVAGLAARVLMWAAAGFTCLYMFAVLSVGTLAVAPDLARIEGASAFWYDASDPGRITTYAVLTFVLMIFAQQLSIRAFRATLRATTNIDDRAPILFLRSFKDDQVRFPSSMFAEPLRQMRTGFAPGNLDQLLVEEALGYGPVVALGRPGEDKPPLGARRAYVRHESWQDTASDLLTRARAIVIVLDNTPGTRWEIETILRSELRNKTLFLLPPSRTMRNGLDWLAEIPELRDHAEGKQTVGFWRRPDQSEWVFQGGKQRADAYRIAIRTFFRAMANDPRLDARTLGDDTGRYVKLGSLA